MISNDFLPIVPSPYGFIVSLTDIYKFIIIKDHTNFLEICSLFSSTNTTLVECSLPFDGFQ